jgi:hypothetical protein
MDNDSNQDIDQLNIYLPTIISTSVEHVGAWQGGRSNLGVDHVDTGEIDHATVDHTDDTGNIDHVTLEHAAILISLIQSTCTIFNAEFRNEGMYE